MSEFERHLDNVVHHLENDHLLQAGQEVKDLHPADIAHIIDYLPDEQKRDLFTVLPAKVAAEVVVDLSDYSRDEVLDGILTQRLADIVDDMPSDEATDLVAELPREQAREVLSRIDHEDSAEVRTLLQYDEETAGGLMQLELASARASSTVSQVIEDIRNRAEELGDLHNVFIVDQEDRVQGLVTLASLVLASPDTKVGALVEPCPFVVNAQEDQEHVAHKFRHYDVVSAPVVDEDGRLLGRVTIDDVMEVLEEEAQEDMARMAGLSAEEDILYSQKVFKASWLRLPWLLSNMCGGLVTGWLLWMFKVTLSDALFLLAFIPVITAMAGNVGVQSSTIMVRGMAVGKVNFGNLKSMLFREVRVAAIMGLICGAAVGTVASIWHGRAILGVVVGLSMTSAICTASILGTLAPALLRKLNVDPAISSGPVVTTVNDIVGIMVYFLISLTFYEALIR